MARNRPHRLSDEDVDEEMDKDTLDVGRAATVIEKGRHVLDHLPDAAAGVRGALAEAEAQMEGLSDTGVVAASGFALGVSAGLLLAGAPRVVLAASGVAVMLTLRSALARGIHRTRLLS